LREQRGVKKMKLTAKTTEEDVVEGEVSWGAMGPNYFSKMSREAALSSKNTEISR